MIGIIGAIDHELNNFFTNMIIARTEIIADKTFYIGKIKNHNVVLVKSGIGKVNATITTTILINHFNVRLVINTGVAGGLLPIKVGDLVIAKGISYFDVSLTEIDDVPYGKMGNDPLIVEIDESYLVKAKSVCENLNYKYHIGNLVSGDKFVTKKKDITKIQKQVSDILGVEMEGMAIALTAYKFNIPFVSLRGISDIIEAANQPKGYRDVVKEVAYKTSEFVIKFLEVVDA